MTTEYTTEELVALSDALLTNLEGHLKKEFDKGRLQGTEYAQVYIAMVQTSAQQAQGFLLGKDAAAVNHDYNREQLKVLQERHGMNLTPEYP